MQKGWLSEEDLKAPTEPILGWPSGLISRLLFWTSLKCGSCNLIACWLALRGGGPEGWVAHEMLSVPLSSCWVSWYWLPIMSSLLNYLTGGHLANCNHCYQITEAPIKPKGLKNVTIVLMFHCYHPAGQQALAYVTPFCPKLIQCLRTGALSRDHLFTLLLKELHSPTAS